jgi:hypothetical protein
MNLCLADKHREEVGASLPGFPVEPTLRHLPLGTASTAPGHGVLSRSAIRLGRVTETGRKSGRENVRPHRGNIISAETRSRMMSRIRGKDMLGVIRSTAGSSLRR